MNRFVFALLSVLLLAAVSGTLGWAQDVIVPDTGVRGSGAIAVGPNVGLFDINVAKSGTNPPFGGFRFQVVTPTGQRGALIVSKQVTSLVVIQHTATVQATGFLNGVPADITVVAFDGGSIARDTFEITADPSGPIDMASFGAGGPVIKGDIVVFSPAPAPQGTAYGSGAIRVNTNVARFDFRAVKTTAGVKGTINYTESNPLVLSPIIRPPVRIYVPAVKTLDITGNTAVLTGHGFLNGRPALVRVTAIDNRNPIGPATRPDEFYITASPINALTAVVDYYAGGPLIAGDIAVKGSP